MHVPAQTMIRKPVHENIVHFGQYIATVTQKSEPIDWDWQRPATAYVIMHAFAYMLKMKYIGS